MKKIPMVVALTILLGAVSFAQNGQGREFGRKSTIIVTVDGLSCTTSAGTGMFPALTWSFGATQTLSSATGGSASKANLSDVSITKRTDSCSPILFGDVVTGKHIRSVMIVQQDNNRDDVFSVKLEDVIISNYQLSGNHADEVPSEQISFNYAKITLTDAITGTKFGWDLRLGRTF
jgi:type VI secretion system Hcp family effector